jgi:hypothetical protein
MTTTNNIFKSLLEFKELSDLTIVEESYNGSKEHSVHKIIMCASSQYFKGFFSQKGMKDSDTDRITIKTETDDPNLLEIVIKAIYTSSFEEMNLIYTAFIDNLTINESIALYMVCDFLQLDEHICCIKDLIYELKTLKQLILWWRECIATDKFVHPIIEEILHKHLQNSVDPTLKFMSIDTLLDVCNIDDPIMNLVQTFMSKLNTNEIVHTAKIDIKKRSGGYIEIDVNSDKLEKIYGFFCGERVSTNAGYATVIGICKLNELWFHIDGQKGISFWKNVKNRNDLLRHNIVSIHNQNTFDQNTTGQMPEEKMPEEKIPEEKMPEEKMPEEKMPEDKMPEEKMPEERHFKRKYRRRTTKRKNTEKRNIRKNSK